MELNVKSIALLKAAINDLLEENIPKHYVAFETRREIITKAALSTLSKGPAHYAPAWCKELLRLYE